MAAQGFVMFDPFSAELRNYCGPDGKIVVAPNWFEFEKELRKLSKRIYERNVAAGKANPLEFCMILREQKPNSTADHCFVMLHGPACGLNHSPAGGATTHIEALTDGRWRLATIEEETACRRQDAEKVVLAKASRNQKISAELSAKLLEVLNVHNA